MSAVRIAVIDDHESVRLGLQAVCAAAGHRIVSSTAGVAEFLEIRVPVDVVVLDLSLGDGSSVAENVRAVSRDGAAVLIHSIADRVGLVREALAAGAAGVIPKSSPAHDVVAAIETVAGGGPLTNLEWASAIEADRQFAVAQLGPRERDVLSLYASGLPLKDVAVELGIAPLDREGIPEPHSREVCGGGPSGTHQAGAAAACGGGRHPGRHSRRSR